MKYCIDKYPMGSFTRQESAGKYMDGYLHSNLEPLAKKIINDMTFLGIIYSSTLEVGTGKSVLAQQLGEAYTEMVNKIHGLDIKFDINNIVFTPKDLIDRSFKLPKYSCIVLDEWEDAHYWSELGVTLRQFFRKCRQLNLFMIIIIPNYFQLPVNYAVSRSIFAIDVKFEGEFERGYFSFYNFDRKKDLYLNGKKTYNYKCVFPNFSGRFTDGYAVGREEYIQRKREDLDRADNDKKKVTDIKVERQVKTQVWFSCEGQYPIKNATQMAGILGMHRGNLSTLKKELESDQVTSEEIFENNDNDSYLTNFPVIKGGVS